MSGARFFVGIGDELCSEKVLKFRSLFKVGVDFSKHDELKPSHISQIIPEAFVTRESEIMVANLPSETTEVVQLLACYVAKKIISRTKCNECQCLITAGNNDSSMNLTVKKYLQDLSRGGLYFQSTPFEDIINSCFFGLKYGDEFFSKEVKLETAEVVLHEYTSKSMLYMRRMLTWTTSFV